MKPLVAALVADDPFSVFGGFMASIFKSYSDLGRCVEAGVTLGVAAARFVASLPRAVNVPGAVSLNGGVQS